jgi:hypothetical protein
MGRTVISGRQTLDGITRALKEERARLQDADRRIKTASERIVAIDAARAKEVAALARVHVGHLAAGAADALDAGDARVVAILRRRADEREGLEAKLAQIDADAERHAAERAHLEDALEAATAALDAAEAETQARLEGDEAYRAQRDRAVAAERTARHADEKAQQSEEERIQKGRAYEADPIFLYLWRRAYGTPAYRAWPLTRWLDGKVARLIGYDGARANYARLVDLPVRLREHADAKAAAADAEYEALRRLDEEARVADGVDALERDRAAADTVLATHDAAAADLESTRRTTFEALERIDLGEDAAYAEAVDHLATELGRADVQALRREALATPYPEDDVIVGRLLDLEAERSRLATEVEDLKGVAEQNRARVRELEGLRRDFTSRRFDEPGSGFPDGDLVTSMLSQFLRGAATREVLWRVLEGQRRSTTRRSNPTFGSGGFGRGSPWGGGPLTGSSGRSGGGRARGGVGGARPSGTLSGGGFRTGGRMGGRGFKTGGRR